jgi:hypothetical protein
VVVEVVLLLLVLWVEVVVDAQESSDVAIRSGQTSDRRWGVVRGGECPSSDATSDSVYVEAIQASVGGWRVWVMRGGRDCSCGRKANGEKVGNGSTRQGLARSGAAPFF